MGVSNNDLKFLLSDFFNGGEISITERGLFEIRELCSIVFSKHYSYVSLNDRDDLISEGVLKCISLLHKGQFDLGLV